MRIVALFVFALLLVLREARSAVAEDESPLDATQHPLERSELIRGLDEPLGEAGAEVNIEPAGSEEIESDDTEETGTEKQKQCPPLNPEEAMNLSNKITRRQEKVVKTKTMLEQAVKGEKYEDAAELKNTLESAEQEIVDLQEKLKAGVESHQYIEQQNILNSLDSVDHSAQSLRKLSQDAVQAEVDVIVEVSGSDK